ncbi:hypothetical protein NRA37_06840 [Acinetobacter baumannii]|nr:hypothetical protein [Acinetobacter baumannii]
MKPEQFIREFGLDKAREVVEAAIDGSTHAIYKQADGLINLRDLKRLVESLDIIDALEGIKGAKGTLYNLIQLEWDEFEHRYIDNWTCTKERLEHAIRDHESIYGGGDD